MKTLVIVPTYNEAENIQQLIHKIRDTAFSKIDILIIDDNSTDQTQHKVERMKCNNNDLFLIKRSGKLGLSSAYIRGFNWGLNRDYDLFIQMDGDLSHDPKYLSDMIDQANEYDVVIGSRYVSQGGVENWNKLRSLISWCGNMYARLILGLKIRDVTSGFCIWSRSVLKQLKLNQIYSDGYSFQVEMKYRSLKNGFSITEIPIVFKGREEGESKMSKKIFFEAIWMMWWLRFKI